MWTVVVYLVIRSFPSRGADLPAHVREVVHYGHRGGHGERAGPGGAGWTHRGQRGRQPGVRCEWEEEEWFLTAMGLCRWGNCFCPC